MNLNKTFGLNSMNNSIKDMKKLNNHSNLNTQEPLYFINFFYLALSNKFMKKGLKTKIYNIFINGLFFFKLSLFNSNLFYWKMRINTDNINSFFLFNLFPSLFYMKGSSGYRLEISKLKSINIKKNYLKVSTNKFEKFINLFIFNLFIFNLFIFILPINLNITCIWFLSDLYIEPIFLKKNNDYAFFEKNNNYFFYKSNILKREDHLNFFSIKHNLFDFKSTLRSNYTQSSTFYFLKIIEKKNNYENLPDSDQDFSMISFYYFKQIIDVNFLHFFEELVLFLSSNNLKFSSFKTPLNSYKKNSSQKNASKLNYNKNKLIKFLISFFSKTSYTQNELPKFIQNLFLFLFFKSSEFLNLFNPIYLNNNLFDSSFNLNQMDLMEFKRFLTNLDDLDNTSLNLFNHRLFKNLSHYRW